MSNSKVESNRGVGVKPGQFGHSRSAADDATASSRAGGLDVASRDDLVAIDDPEDRVTALVVADGYESTAQDMGDEWKWGTTTTAWDVSIVNDDGDVFETPFYKGAGHKGVAPTTDEVVGCMASDYSMMEGVDWDYSQYCADMGYDEFEEDLEPGEVSQQRQTFDDTVEQSTRFAEYMGDRLHDYVYGEQ